MNNFFNLQNQNDYNNYYYQQQQQQQESPSSPASFVVPIIDRFDPSSRTSSSNTSSSSNTYNFNRYHHQTHSLDRNDNPTNQPDQFINPSSIPSNDLTQLSVFDQNHHPLRPININRNTLQPNQLIPTIPSTLPHQDSSPLNNQHQPPYQHHQHPHPHHHNHHHNHHQYNSHQHNQRTHPSPSTPKTQLSPSLAAFTESIPNQLITNYDFNSHPKPPSNRSFSYSKSSTQPSMDQTNHLRPRQPLDQPISRSHYTSIGQVPSSHISHLNQCPQPQPKPVHRSTSQPSLPASQFYSSKSRRVSFPEKISVPNRRQSNGPPLTEIKEIRPRSPPSQVPVAQTPVDQLRCSDQQPHTQTPSSQSTGPQAEQSLKNSSSGRNGPQPSANIQNDICLPASSADAHEAVPSKAPSLTKVAQTSVEPLQQPVPPDIPPSITLLYLARLHLRQARDLVPQLFLKPGGPTGDLKNLDLPKEKLNENPESGAMKLAKDTSTYRRHITIAIACLRSIIGLSQEASASISAEFNLITRCLLVETLLRETEDLKEAAEVIQQGLIIARQGESLAPLKFTLLELQILMEARDQRVPSRQIKKQLERCVEMTMKNDSVDPKHVVWYYRFQLLLSEISYERDKDLPVALAALRNILTVAESRNDKELWIAVRTREARLAMDRSQWALAGDILKSITSLADIPSEQEHKDVSSGHIKHEPGLKEKVVIGQQLRVYIMILLTLYYSITGLSKSAKSWLKQLQDAMDRSEQTEGEIEGTYKVYLQSPSSDSRQRRLSMITPIKKSFSSSPKLDSPFTKLFGDFDIQDGSHDQSDSTSSKSSQYILISTMPRELLYTFIYVLGLAVHFDGHGKSPRALLYAQEGTKQIDRQLAVGLQSLNRISKMKSGDFRFDQMVMGLEFMKRCLERLIDLKIEANLMVSQLAIIRSDFEEADKELVNVIRLARLRGRWESLSGRITLIKGFLSNSTLNMTSARRSFLASIFITNSSSTSNPYSSSNSSSLPLSQSLSSSSKLNESYHERISLSNEVNILAKCSYILVRLSDEKSHLERDVLIERDHQRQVNNRSNENGGKDRTKNSKRKKKDKRGEDFERNERLVSLQLDQLTKELSVVGNFHLSNLNMAVQVVLALRCGEIVRAKQHLTIALNEANKTSNTHLKTILLGLISSMFLNTRNDQAFKMLHSCFKLSIGFNSGKFDPKIDPSSKSSSSFSTGSNSSNNNKLYDDDDDGIERKNRKGVDDLSFNGHYRNGRVENLNGLEGLVGHAFLGFWAGKKLLEIYEHQGDEVKVKKQLALNFAHENVMFRIPLL